VHAQRPPSSRRHAPGPPAAGTFRPGAWEPLSDPLFDVVPPDEDNAAQVEWYNSLVAVTALATRHIVGQVNRNYRRRAGVNFSGWAKGVLDGYTLTISQVFLENALTQEEVNSQLGRLVKTVNLVVYDPEPGPCQWWPMATQILTWDEIVTVIHNAFDGLYPRFDPERTDDL
jgi:hypothetical protein